MKVDEINKLIKETLIEEKDIRIEYERWSSKLSRVNKKLQELMNKKDAALLSKMTLKNADWEYLLTVMPDSEVKHKIRNKMAADIRKKYKLFYCNFQFSGYYPEINQSRLQIGLVRGNLKNTSSVIKAMKKVLPFIKYEDDMYKKMQIIENTLSERASYCLLIDKEGKCKVQSSCKYQNDNFKWGTLENTMKYIQDYLWYEDYTY